MDFSEHISVYREVRDNLIECKVSLGNLGLESSLIYRVLVSLIDFLSDLL